MQGWNFSIVIGVFVSTILLGSLGLAEKSEVTQQGVNGGQPVQKADPVSESTVAIGGDKRYHCSAAIVAQDLLITAAHCLARPVTKIYFGLDSRTPERTIEVHQAIGHPHYAKAAHQNRNDIALIHFKGGLPEGYVPLPLAGRGYYMEKGQKVIVAGYGVDLIKRERAFLKKTVIEVLEPKVTETEIKFKQTEENGVCSGDSGGPALLQDSQGLVLVGIANYVGTRRCGEYAVHASPNAHLDWLLETARLMRNLESDSEPDVQGIELEQTVADL